MGYPIEFVPQANPYEKYSGENLEVKLMLNGKPLPNQLVYANHLESAHAKSNQTHQHDRKTHSHDDSEKGHTHTSGQQLRTNDQGIVSVNLPEEGIYYLRTIHMVNVTDSEELTHQSKWATLTFEVTLKHGKDTHTHDEHEGQIPSWFFILGSILLIGLLFLIFRKKNS